MTKRKSDEKYIYILESKIDDNSCFSSCIVKDVDDKILEADVMILSITQNRSLNRSRLRNKKELGEEYEKLNKLIQDSDNFTAAIILLISSPKPSDSEPFKKHNPERWKGFPLHKFEKYLLESEIKIKYIEDTDFLSTDRYKSVNEVDMYNIKKGIDELNELFSDSSSDSECLVKISRNIWNTVNGNVYHSVNNGRNLKYCYVTGEISFADDRDHLLAMPIMQLILSKCQNDLNDEYLKKICNIVHCLKTDYHRKIKSLITDDIFRNVTRRMLYEDDEITEEEIFRMHVVKFEEEIKKENNNNRNIYIQLFGVYCKILPCLISYFLNIINAWKSLDGVITFEQIYPVTMLHFEGFVNACKLLHCHETNAQNIENMLVNLKMKYLKVIQ